MAITISGQNNNDKIVASDGVLDMLSGFNVVGVMTANSFDVGSNIKLGNAGIITATTVVGNVTGNLTGNINHTSNILLQISGSEKFRVGTSGQFGIAGANYGTSGQVLTSGGSGSAPTWSTINSDAINEGNTKAEVSDTGTNGRFFVETEGTEKFSIASTGDFTFNQCNDSVFNANGNLTLDYKISNSLKYRQQITGSAVNNILFNMPWTIWNNGDAATTMDFHRGDRIQVGTGVSIAVTGNIVATGIVTATSYRGDGSQLTGITGTTINNNADNRIITGSGTANTLEGEANLTFDGTEISVGTGATISSVGNVTAGIGTFFGGATFFGNVNFISATGTNLWSFPGGSFKPSFNNFFNIGDTSYRVKEVFTNDLDIGGTVELADSIIHAGDTNTKIRFPAADTFSVETAGSEALRIDSSQRLLLGTTTEGHANADDFTVSSSGDTGITIRSGSSNLGNIYFSDGTSGDAEYRGIVQYEHANDKLNFGTSAGTRLSITSTGAVTIGSGTGSSGGGLAIYGGTVNQASGQDAALYVRHDSNADWGMWLYKQHEYGFRIDSNSSATLSLAIYDHSGNLKHQFKGNGDYTASGSVDSASDIKLKTNIKTIDSALDKVLQLRGAEYDRIDKDNQHEIGVIAQEVEKVIPEVVHGDETKSVSYGNMVAVLIEAIKEQNDVINKMKKEIEDLKG